MGQKLAVPFKRGERVSFPESKVYAVTDPDLPRSLRRSLAVEEGAPTAVDLFAGAGGLSLGLSQAAFHVLMAADNDTVACETYSNALGGVSVCTDLAKPSPLLEALRNGGIERVDLVAGGPPCQPFSRAGKSKIRSLEKAGRSPDERPLLWLAFLDFIRALTPNLVLLENVPDMVLWDGGETIRTICSSLEQEGYVVHSRVLECWRFGVPQHRQRLFVVGVRPPYVFQWPKPGEKFTTIRDAVSDLPRIGPGQDEYWQELVEPATSDLQKRLRDDDASQISDHITRDVREDDRKAFQLLKEGRSYGELPSGLRRYRSDIFDDKYNVLGWDELSRSITAHIAKDGYWYIHPDAERTLSIREAARLQTFPDWFRFAGHPSARYRQIGNAVPPEMGRQLGLALKTAMSAPDHEREQMPFRGKEFRRLLLRWHRRGSRSYPWRRLEDPWLVLAAEVLLRRTRADAVAKVWEEFARRFKTPKAVTRNPEQLRKLLYPLGLRWRVENLLKIADALVKEWKGVVPKDRSGLMSLPGVGDYVADAVLAFAFDQRAVLVDSNTARVASRVFGLAVKWSSLRNLSLRASVARLSGNLAPTPALNFALLDLGGTICLPTRPQCGRCPVRDLCVTGRDIPPEEALFVQA